MTSAQIKSMMRKFGLFTHVASKPAKPKVKIENVNEIFRNVKSAQSHTICKR